MHTIPQSQISSLLPPHPHHYDLPWLLFLKRVLKLFDNYKKWKWEFFFPYEDIIDIFC